MPLIPMHPSLHDVYRRFDSHYGNTRINVNDQIDVEDLLVNIIVDNLQYQKPTLVVTSETQDPAWIAKVLSKYQLSKYCLVWTPNYIEKQEPLKRIQSFIKSNPLDFDKDRHRILRNELEDIESVIKSSLSFLSVDVMGPLSWSELLQKWCQIEQSSEDSDYSLSPDWKEFNYSEYIYTIGEAESDFKSDYVLLHELSPFHTDVYSPSFDLESLLDELTSRKEELEEIGLSIKNQFNLLRSEIAQEVYDTYGKVTKLVQLLEKHAFRLNARGNDSENKNRPFEEVCSVLEYHSIESLLEELEQQLQRQKFIDVTWPNTNRSRWTVAKFGEIISDLLLATEDFKINIGKRIDEKLRRLGPYNIQNQALTILDKRFNTFVEELNSSELLQKKHVNNALNFENKLELIQEIQSELYRCIVFLESHPDYFEWRASLQKDQVDTVLNDLSFKSEAWKPIVAKALLTKCLFDHFDPQILSIGDDVNHLRNKKGELNKSILDSIHHNIWEDRSKQVNRFKKEDGFAFQQLIKNENAKNGVFDLFVRNQETFTSFFPIMVTTEKDYNDIKINLDETKWNKIIALDTEVVSESKSVLSVDINRKIDDPQSFQFQIEDFKKINHLKSIAVTERYEDAVRVAKLLMSVVSEVSIYQMRDASIISCLSDEMEEMVSMQFIPQGIKCLHRNITSIEGVTEAIINAEVEFFLWIENGFIGKIDTDNMIWHQNAVKSLMKIGIQVQNFESGKIFSDRKSVLKSIRQSILGAGTQKPEGAIYADT